MRPTNKLERACEPHKIARKCVLCALYAFSGARAQCLSGSPGETVTLGDVWETGPAGAQSNPQRGPCKHLHAVLGRRVQPRGGSARQKARPGNPCSSHKSRLPPFNKPGPRLGPRAPRQKSSVRMAGTRRVPHTKERLLGGWLSQ